MKDKVLCSIDTNVLIYAFDKRNIIKQKIAEKIISECVIKQNTILTLQSLAEFFNASRKKGVLTQAEALNHVEMWQQVFPIVSAKSETVNQAIRAVIDHRLSFWDAMLWSTLHEAKVSTLYTEDFQHGLCLGNVTCVNPFEA